MIDVHVHAAPPRLPGVGALSPLLNQPPEAVAAVLREQMQSAGVTEALAMGSWRGTDDDPLGVAATLRLAGQVPGLHAVGVADPTRTDADHLRRAEAALAAGRVRALKGYLGYLHYAPEHPNYAPYYRTSRSLPRAVHLPHRRHVFAVRQAEVRPSAPGRRRCG